MGEITGESQGFQITTKSTLADGQMLDGDMLDDDEGVGFSDIRRREGLPPTFQMRHDAHYVEQLTERAAPHAIRLIPVADIDRNGGASLGSEIEVLANSMRDVGVLQPLLVRPAGDRYHVISGTRRLHAATIAGLRHVPCIVHDADDAMVENIRGSANLPADAPRSAVANPGSCLSGAAVTELAESLEAACACLALNTKSTFTGRVAKELLGIELQRAGRVARAAAFLSMPQPLAPRDLLLSALVHDVVASTDAARRMVGVKIDVAIADRESWMRADGQLLTMALAGTMDAILAQLAGPATVRIAVRGAGVSATVSVELSMTPAPAGISAARFFDAPGAEHPWGAWAGVLLKAAAQIADVHGGHAELRCHTSGECTLAFVLPRR